jgi:hypothetical protein
MRLDVRELAGEELLHPLDGEILGDVDELAPAVIAAARIAFRIFVGEDRALSLEHRLRDEVLRGDQLDVACLTVTLLGDRVGDLRIGLGQRADEHALVPRTGQRAVGYSHGGFLV